MITIHKSILLALFSFTPLLPAQDLMRHEPVITSEGAQKLIQSVVTQAKERKVVVCIAVTDPGGCLIALHRMDGAKPAVVGVAIDKAYSAAIYRATTGKLQQISQPGAEAYGLQSRPGVATFQGGVPITFKDQHLGGLGVSGAAAVDDEAMALAAINTLSIVPTNNQPASK
jgi:uncharacterized protein GlcG (DUF336 family)